MTTTINTFLLFLMLMGAPKDEVAVPLAEPLHSSDVMGRIGSWSYDSVWLARCIMSETRDRDEMYYVAWVVRNRVETAYRGKTTYRDVILDRYQFSAFNGGWMRRYYLSLGPGSDDPDWKMALEVAWDVLTSHDRPFDKTVRHFFSEVSMRNRTHPFWSHGEEPLVFNHIDEERFRFYDGIL